MSKPESIMIDEVQYVRADNPLRAVISLIDVEQKAWSK